MRDRYVIENTKFIWKTNWAGEIRKEDRFPSKTRRGCILIPDPEMAHEMAADGFRVRQTQPYEGEEEGFVPEYYVEAKMKFMDEGARSNPSVYLVDEEDYAQPLDMETVGIIDEIRVDRVNVILNPYSSAMAQNPTLYVRTMYVFQDLTSDPWANLYRRHK